MEDKRLIDALLNTEKYINELTKIVWILMYACGRNGMLTEKDLEKIQECAKKANNL